MYMIDHMNTSRNAACLLTSISTMDNIKYVNRSKAVMLQIITQHSLTCPVTIVVMIKTFFEIQV